MKDTELRELCTRFLDAVERRDVDAVADLYAPGLTFWVNLTGAETGREANLETLREGYTKQRRRTYDDRTIDVFEGGFVIRYTLHGVQHDGHRGALWICIVGLCRDGRITRIDEYMDSGKFAAWAGIPRAARRDR